MKTRFSFVICMMLVLTSVAANTTVRIGIIGLDTSHSPAFVKSINAENPKPAYVGFQVVAAYPYGSKAIQSSLDRIPKLTEDVKKFGVKITSSIEELLKEVDCVLLETNDGNMHLEQALEVFKAGKPVFIDKPIGANLAQAIAIFEMAEKYNVPMFSSSALRYGVQTQKLRNGESGKVVGVDTYAPGRLEPSHADFAWYGIHGIESLYTMMGVGCESVQRTYTEGSDFLVGKWKDGRIGTVRGIRDGKSGYGGIALTNDKGVVPAGAYEGYDVLLVEVVKFFNTKVAPVSKEETLEIFAFIEAADISRKNGGKAVSIEEAMKKGQKEAKKLIKKL
ncbi:MAG: Gfo/Idh/MocA family oxidoreductase, partial [Paludibacter sp.]|nr:Gfo/Idh/MocA family oxidoreductase [Paludibacter sp.]